MAFQQRTAKKQSFYARLKPTTKKAKILTFAAAFVVIGGGIMVYRSFAAVPASNVSGTMLMNNSAISTGSKPATSQTGNFCLQTQFKRTNRSGGEMWYLSQLQVWYRNRWQSPPFFETRGDVSSTPTNAPFEKRCYDQNQAMIELYGGLPLKIRLLTYTYAGKVNIGFQSVSTTAQINYKIWDSGFTSNHPAPTSTDRSNKNPSTPAPSPTPQPAPSK